ncbi:kinase-like protein, partial [Terfezia boudieri ATCC MYA-4762]
SRYKTDFTELAFLGKGGFASVYKVKNNLDGREYAIKKVPIRAKHLNDKDKLDVIFKEIKTLAKLEHGNIVRYYSAWVESATGLMAKKEAERKEILTLMIMMSVHPLTLKEFLRNEGSESTQDSAKYCWHLKCALKLFRGVLDGAEYLHNKGIVHRDLKPGNIFLNIEAHDQDVNGAKDKGLDCRYCDKRCGLVPRIGDFGLVAELVDGYQFQFANTPLNGPGVAAHHSRRGKNIICEKTDIYALGIIFFELLYRCDTGSERVKCIMDVRE